MMENMLEESFSFFKQSIEKNYDLDEWQPTQIN